MEQAKTKKRKGRKIMWIVLSIIAVLVAGTVIFINTSQFGRTPRGERKERILNSPNYRDGKFQNIHDTPQLTSDKNMATQVIDYLFVKKERLTPEKDIPAVKTDLLNLSKDEDVLIWFGHSSYFMQVAGKRMLVDPVFSNAASPVPFFNRSFQGTAIYSAGDMPDIDYLFISHDHWDHLDYPTVKALRERTGKVFCGLGVGEHFERWGFAPDQVVEMDWNEKIMPDAGFEIICLPARHFSGRSLFPNQSLWVSFLLQSPNMKIYMGGDSGYDTHFSEIGKQFGPIDLALLEDGQYNEGWKYIHMLPYQVPQAAKDLQAKNLMPVHNSRYALGSHPWDEPLNKISELHAEADYRLITPVIGEIVNLSDSTQTFTQWWKE